VDEIKKILLTRSDLKSIGITFSNSQLLRLEAIGRFPKRLRLGGATVCWDKLEVGQWLEARRAEREHWVYGVCDA